MKNAIIEIERTIEILRRSSCDPWVAELEQLLAEVHSSNLYTQKEGLFRIGQICHPKALSDVHMTAIDWHAWQAQLERLHDACARAFNMLEGGGTA